MTRKALSQIYYLQKELQMWERELEAITQTAIKSPTLSAEPKAFGGKSDPTAELAMKQAEIQQLIDALRLNVIRLQKEALDFIKTIDDTLLRQIVEHRCVKCESWNKVAAEIGITPDAARMIYNRAIPKM